jgi:hypothetical protein
LKLSKERWIIPDRIATAAILLGCLLIVLLGVVLQSRVHINHDVGWIAHSAAWLLDGKRFGTDILDPNPPLAWFLMLPAVAAARAGIVPEIVAVQAWSWMLTVAGLALSFMILQPLARVIGRLETTSLMLVSTAVVAILPIGDFGQRDVIAFALMLPYLSSLLGRVAGLPPGRWVSILTGICAGIGLCLKPFLLAVPLLAEPLQALFARNLRPLIRAETLMMAGAVLSYAVAILLFARDYLEFALPLVRAVYWAYDNSAYLVLGRFRDAAWPAVYAAGIALVTLSFTRMHWMLLAWIAGFSACYWLQGKGFPYHAYPVLGASCLFLAYTVVHAGRCVWHSVLIRRPVMRWFVLAALLLVAAPVLYEPFWQAQQWYRSADPQTGDWGRMRQAVIDRLRAQGVGAGDYLYAFSTHPHPGFPTVNYLGAQWSGRMVAQFAVPAYVRRSEVKDPALLTQIDRAMALQLAIVVEDLQRNPPSYVMVEQRQWRLGLAFRKFDDLAFYKQDPDFVQLWNCYVEIEPVGQIRLFRRRDRCQAG